MRNLFSMTLAAGLVLCGAGSYAQDVPLTTATPQCGIVKNESDRSMTGSIRTNYYPRPDGTKAHHESTFRLAPDEEKEFCSTGPFYPGYKVGLVLRTLAPVFDCKTRLAGTISLKADKKSDGSVKIYAICIP